MAIETISRVRSFNRMVTMRAGALEESYLGRGRPLGQARILFEIGRDGCDVRALRTRLGLDSGYFSRVLRALERQGFVATTPLEGDRRRRRVTLTPAGQAEWNAYDALSNDLARSILRPLNEAQRDRLLAAMAEIERLMTASAVTIEAEPVDGEAARTSLESYFRELAERFEGGFDPGPGGAAGDVSMAPPGGAFLVARLDGRDVACGGLRTLEPGVGEIKRMWVAPDARGLGLARRLLAALEDEARALGLSRIRLDTNRVLAEAQALYRKAGYREIARFNDNPYAHFWFEKALG